MASRKQLSGNTNLFPDWERKERLYIWAGKVTPPTSSIQGRHTKHKDLLYFDDREDYGYPRALRYVTNQKTFFEDEQVEPYLLGSIVFENGELKTKPNDTILQQFLEIHPDNVSNGGTKFFLFDPEAKAQEEMKKEELSFSAMETFFAMDAIDLEPIARVMIGSEIDKLKTNELKRDLLIHVKLDPEQFLKLANNSDIKMLNLTTKLIDSNIIKIKDDNVTVVWAKNGKEIVKIPFSTDPKGTFSKYLKTDEGILLQESLLDKL